MSIFSFSETETFFFKVLRYVLRIIVRVRSRFEFLIGHSEYCSVRPKPRSSLSIGIVANFETFFSFLNFYNGLLTSLGDISFVDHISKERFKNL